MSGLDWTRKARFSATVTALGALLAVVPPSFATPALGPCTPSSADFWSALDDGQNPTAAALGGPATGWALEDFKVRYVTIENGVNQVVQGEDIGFRLYKSPHVEPGGIALLWGTPGEVHGLISDDAGMNSIASIATAPGSFCLVSTRVELGVASRTDYADVVVSEALEDGAKVHANDPPDPDRLCAPGDKLWFCTVGDTAFCMGLGVSNAFNKMFTIIAAAWNTYDTYTHANNWGGAWLKCYDYADPDPFDSGISDPSLALADFMANEYHQPNGVRSIMHLFAPRIGGGAAFCESEWSVGGYGSGDAAANLYEKNVFLHETGHNFDAAHEDTSHNCANGLGHADQLKNGNYDIMYFDVPGGDANKDRVFSDGGNLNVNPNKDNLCFINDNVDLRLGVPFTPECDHVKIEI